MAEPICGKAKAVSIGYEYGGGMYNHALLGVHDNWPLRLALAADCSVPCGVGTIIPRDGTGPVQGWATKHMIWSNNRR